MSSVFLVQRDNGIDNLPRTETVFSTKEKAEEYLNGLSPRHTKYPEYEIEEYELDSFEDEFQRRMALRLKASETHAVCE